MTTTATTTARVSHLTGHEEGETYFSRYWRGAYRVAQVHDNGSVTVQWADGHSTTHMTALEPEDVTCRIGYRVHAEQARTHYEAGGRLVVAESDRGANMPVFASTTVNRHSDTPWDDLVAMIDVWRNRHPHQTFYIV